MYIPARFVRPARRVAGAVLLVSSSAIAIGAVPALAQEAAHEEPAAAQAAASGAIFGRILDPATGEYLRGAIIVIETADGRRRTVNSGDGGQFRAGDLAPGPANITVAYTGYVSHSGTVELKAEPSPYDVELHSTTRSKDISGNAIVVSASFLEGDARAIMDQRRSMDIKNNLSTESYGDIADGNPAEFIKFMTGVDTDGTTGSAVNIQLRGLPAAMTGVTLDGMNLASADANDGADTSRAASFEGLSLAGIDSIEISKTTSADVDANSPAGTVNIRTKRAGRWLATAHDVRSGR